VKVSRSAILRRSLYGYDSQAAPVRMRRGFFLDPRASRAVTGAQNSHDGVDIDGHIRGLGFPLHLGFLGQ
jgi:hypothetical protein